MDVFSLSEDCTYGQKCILNSTARRNGELVNNRRWRTGNMAKKNLLRLAIFWSNRLLNFLQWSLFIFIRASDRIRLRKTGNSSVCDCFSRSPLEPKKVNSHSTGPRKQWYDCSRSLNVAKTAKQPSRNFEFFSRRKISITQNYSSIYPWMCPHLEALISLEPI